MFSSKLLARLALVVTLLSMAAGMLESVSPKYALLVGGLSGALSAFLTRVQPKP